MLSIRTHQRGDTIIEVLITVAIISLVLASAYAISTKNTLAMQGSQERLQAQHLVEAQIEALRAKGGISVSGNCYDGVNETATCNNFKRSGSGATYTARVVGPTGFNNVPPNKYTITVSWTSPGASTDDDSSVVMTYRLN